MRIQFYQHNILLFFVHLLVDVWGLLDPTRLLVHYDWMTSFFIQMFKGFQCWVLWLSQMDISFPYWSPLRFEQLLRVQVLLQHIVPLHNFNLSPLELWYLKIILELFTISLCKECSSCQLSNWFLKYHIYDIFEI